MSALSASARCGVLVLSPDVWSCRMCRTPGTGTAPCVLFLLSCPYLSTSFPLPSAQKTRQTIMPLVAQNHAVCLEETIPNL